MKCDSGGCATEVFRTLARDVDPDQLIRVRIDLDEFRFKPFATSSSELRLRKDEKLLIDVLSRHSWRQLLWFSLLDRLSLR